MSSTEELEAVVGELQRKFDRLKVLYEQYFMGIEKMEPLTARKELSRGLQSVQGVNTRSTSVRFKISSLTQKWSLYQSYWNRTLREIEQGRYVRHVATARRRAAQAGVEFPEEMLHGVPLHAVEDHHDAAAQGDSEQAPAAARPDAAASPAAVSPVAAQPAASPVNSKRSLPPPLPAEARAPARPLSGPLAAPPVPGYSEDALRLLHQRVVAAQRQAGEASEMRYETLVSQLARQVPKLISEHGCKGVQFDVVTRDGKVKLKPSPVR